MHLLSHELFFGHSSIHGLFDTKQPVWHALDVLNDYLGERRLGVIEGKVDANAHLIHPELISIGAGSIVEPTACIIGPAIIGKNCQIRHGAYLRGNVLTGNQCIIGHASEVKNSILLDSAKAAHFAYLGDSIVGKHANLGAGTRCANLRLDQNEVIVTASDQLFPTGRKKLGAIIGDHCNLGCNCVLNPGTLLTPKTLVYPCSCVKSNLRLAAGHL